MSWDTAISEHGDLIFGANRDLAGISGIDLIEQRIKLRLKIHRGSWVYDTDGTLGSNLQRVIGMSPGDAHSAVGAFVREALRPMADEISIDEVFHEHEDKLGKLTESHEVGQHGIVIVVRYHVIADADATLGIEERQLEISVPVVTGGGE